MFRSIFRLQIKHTPFVHGLPPHVCMYLTYVCEEHDLYTPYTFGIIEKWPSELMAQHRRTKQIAFFVTACRMNMDVTSSINLSLAVMIMRPN